MIFLAVSILNFQKLVRLMRLAMREMLASTLHLWFYKKLWHQNGWHQKHASGVWVKAAVLPEGTETQNTGSSRDHFLCRNGELSTRFTRQHWSYWHVGGVLLQTWGVACCSLLQINPKKTKQNTIWKKNIGWINEKFEIYWNLRLLVANVE